MALSSIRSKEKEEEERQKQLDAIEKFKRLQAQADLGKSIGYTSRDQILSGLGLDVAQSPEAVAFRNSIAEDEGKKYAQDVNFYTKVAPEFNAWQKENFPSRDISKEGETYDMVQNFSPTIKGKKGEPTSEPYRRDRPGVAQTSPDLTRFAVPMREKSPRELANEYGYPASAAPQAKEAMGNLEQQEKLSNISSKSKTIFEELSPEDQKQINAIATRRAQGIDPPDQYIKDFPAFGKNGSIRALVDNLTYENNPDFNAVEANLKYQELTSHASKSGALTPDIINKEANRAAATSSASTRGTEMTKRDVQREQPMFSGENVLKVSQSAIAVKNLQRLRDELSAGNVNYFDIVKETGQFVNPKVANAFQQVGEVVGRSQSGAAIADHEWKQFGKEILNKNFLLTDQGRQTAIENLDDYIERFYNNGQLLTSDPDWYQKYNERGKTGREGLSASAGDTFDEAKKKRLAELRAKKAAGTLGQ